MGSSTELAAMPFIGMEFTWTRFVNKDPKVAKKLDRSPGSKYIADSAPFRLNVGFLALKVTDETSTYSITEQSSDMIYSNSGSSTSVVAKPIGAAMASFKFSKKHTGTTVGPLLIAGSPLFRVYAGADFSIGNNKNPDVYGDRDFRYGVRSGLLEMGGSYMPDTKTTSFSLGGTTY